MARSLLCLLACVPALAFAPRGPATGALRCRSMRFAATSEDAATPAAPRAVDLAPEGEHTEGFVLGGPAEEVAAEELSNANMLRIVRQQTTDRAVNLLLWRCLGYRGEEGPDGSVRWSEDQVFPKWRGKFAEPPDFIGETRLYGPEVDKVVMEANRALVRTIPMAHKQSLKTHLRAEGFAGFKLKELTPNKTRRAQAANWLIFFREELFGKTLEQLQAQREERARQEARKAAEGGSEGPPGFTPPIREVF